MSESRTIRTFSAYLWMAIVLSAGSTLIAVSLNAGLFTGLNREMATIGRPVYLPAAATMPKPVTYVAEGLAEADGAR